MRANATWKNKTTMNVNVKSVKEKVVNILTSVLVLVIRLSVWRSGDVSVLVLVIRLSVWRSGDVLV